MPASRTSNSESRSACAQASGPQVVVLMVQPRVPALLVGAPQLWPGLAGQGEEVGRVPGACGVGLAAGLQPFPGVLAHGL